MILILVFLTTLFFSWLSGRHRAIQDTLRTVVTYNNSIFSNTEKYNINKYHPDHSWKSMYKVDKNNEVIRPLKPRFFGSTTFLSFLTDKWHRSGTISRVSMLIYTGLSFLLPFNTILIVGIIIANYILSNIVFTIYYNQIFKTN